MEPEIEEENYKTGQSINAIIDVGKPSDMAEQTGKRKISDDEQVYHSSEFDISGER